MSPEDNMDSQSTPEEEPKKRGPRKASEVIAETEERVRAEAADEIAALKAQLAAAEQKATAAQEAQAKAETLADQLKPAEIAEVDPDDEDAVTVNFVEDGMTLLGKSFYRGDELTVKRGSREWEELWDKKRNKSFLEYSEDEQIIVWGERKFRPGLWTGLSFEDLLNNPDLTDEERQDLQSILDKRNSRSASPAGYTTSTSQKRSPVAYS